LPWSLPVRNKFLITSALTLGLLAIIPGKASACACGCGVFNLGQPMLPSTLFSTKIDLRFDYMNQDRTQHDAHLVDGALNPDKQIKTGFYTLDLSHRFNRDWGMLVMVPYWNRTFVTDANGTPGLSDASQGVSPQLQTAHAHVLSDVRVMAAYTGFSADLSSGLLAGLKLPTGSFNAGTRDDTGDPIMDRDTQPGTGTTDLLLGAYKMGQSGAVGWFAQGLWRHALDTREGYRPGDSVNLAGGAYYGPAGARLVPMLQLNLQWRGHDRGGGDAQFGNANSGYLNLYLTPGVQINLGAQWQMYAGVYLPVYRHANGYQQVARALGSLSATYQF
jgi:hypothetical protein